MTLLNKKAVKFIHRANQFNAIPLLNKVNKEKGIKQVFLDVTMSRRHKGLWQIARQAGVDPMQLKEGDFLLFINPGASYIAILEEGGGLKYLNRRFAASIEDVIREYRMPIEAKKFLIGFLNQKANESRARKVAFAAANKAQATSHAAST